MNEYLIKYEASPISEITKDKVIKSGDLLSAVVVFKSETPECVQIYSVELI